MEGKDQFIFYTDINSLFYFLGNVIYVNISKYLYSPPNPPILIWFGWLIHFLICKGIMMWMLEMIWLHKVCANIIVSLFLPHFNLINIVMNYMLYQCWIIVVQGDTFTMYFVYKKLFIVPLVDGDLSYKFNVGSI